MKRLNIRPIPLPDETEDLSALLTEIQTQKRKLEEQICKMAYNKSRITNECDVFKWVIRKEFGELRRCLEEEESIFMLTVESRAAALISTLQKQVDEMAENLGKFQEIEGTLEQLNNESQLSFIRKYGSIAPGCREAQQKQQRRDRVYSAITFKPGFHHDDIKITVWKKLHRRVLPGIIPSKDWGSLLHFSATQKYKEKHGHMQKHHCISRYIPHPGSVRANVTPPSESPAKFSFFAQPGYEPAASKLCDSPCAPSDSALTGGATRGPPLGVISDWSHAFISVFSIQCCKLEINCLLYIHVWVNGIRKSHFTK